MRLLTGLGVSIAVALTLIAIGCGGSSDSQFGDGTNGNGSGGPAGSNFGTGEGGTGPGSVVNPTSACATSNAGASLAGANLVFMFDKSGSMDQDSKWTSCKAGLEAFFADPSSAGLYASISFFGLPDSCNVASYATPDAPMRALPDALSFKVRLDAISPSGETPTLPAMQGAIQYAQQVQTTLKAGDKVVIVLVTDGDPNGCNSTPTNVAAAAAAVAASIPTYVIGVGPDAKNLDEIATGGGTAPAIIVDTTNPTQITADLEKAIGAIKKATLSCNFSLPPPPAGKTLDIAAVNVNYTPGGGTLSTIPYSPDCSNAGGWHYDSAVNPSQIVMCPSICTTLQADKSGGAVDIVFGCATVGVSPK
jgi:uncharacterized protein YegL